MALVTPEMLPLVQIGTVLVGVEYRGSAVREAFFVVVSFTDSGAPRVRKLVAECKNGTMLPTDRPDPKGKVITSWFGSTRGSYLVNRHPLEFYEESERD